MKTFIIILSLLSLQAFAQTGKEAFCQEHANLKSIETKMQHYENMLGFGNSSGFLSMNTGVCWWHSRFQRNASYLVQMEPGLPAPTEKEAKAIIKKIISGKEVVIVPGFKNLRMFTIKYSKQITNSLTKWMNTDFLVKQDWTRILKGTGVMSVGDFQEHMKQLNQSFIESDGIVFLMLQFDGPIKHAWLLTNMEKAVNGWDLSIVDSESPMYVYNIFIADDASSIIPEYKYEKNKKFFNELGSRYIRYTAVPYVYQQPELKRIKNVMKEYCNM